MLKKQFFYSPFILCPDTEIRKNKNIEKGKKEKFI